MNMDNNHPNNGSSNSDIYQGKHIVETQSVPGKGKEEAVVDDEDEEEEEEEDEEEDVDVHEDEEEEEKGNLIIDVNVEPHKHILKFKKNDNGNILTVHNTLQEGGNLIRVRLGVCCFNESCTELVTIDKRGNIFVFDLANKKHWRLSQIVLKASLIKAYLHRANQYLIGTKLGHLLQLNTEKSRIVRGAIVADDAVTEISFPGKPLQPSRLVLVHVGGEAVLVNMNTFVATHRLDFDELSISLKFACYMPHSDQIFTCFTNDAVHIWSASTLNRLRITHPVKDRDRQLQLLGADTAIELTLPSEHKDIRRNEFHFNCQDQNYANGLIVSISCPHDGSLLCLSTLDGYLLLLSAYTFKVQRMFHLVDFVFKQCAFLPKPKETLLLGLTTAGQVLMFDTGSTEYKLIVQSANSCYMTLSSDGKLLAVLAVTGEVEVWSTCHLFNTLKSQEKCMQMLRSAFKQNKPLAPVCDGASNECFNQELKKLLKRERLLSILREFGYYPSKYRSLIWCAMLKLPCNQREFQLLLKMGTPPAVQQRALRLKLKNENLRRALIKVWSCLAHWCKVFAHSDFLPHLIFPFVKLFPKNALVTFEICATLICNHFQLWFEFHPLEPANYLGMCENLLQRFDPQLCKFYASLQVRPKDYAWSMLANAFSEVFDEVMWLCLWDNIVSGAPYFPVFCAVAYNIVQREIILRLPDKQTITQFFHEQNPVDVCTVMCKAIYFMDKCPATLHPKRYMKEFKSIPSGVYPKFLHYPKEWLVRHERDVAALERENRDIDDRMRQLELEEYKMMQKLEKGLKDEAYAKRMKEMEVLYQETLAREEERIANQRKMLLLYQKEIRNRKGKIVATLHESERRKKSLTMAKDLDALRISIERERLRNDSDLNLAEDEIHNQEMELLAQKYYATAHELSLSHKYEDDFQRVLRERKRLKNSFKEFDTESHEETQTSTSGHINLEQIERTLDEIQTEFKRLTKKNSFKVGTSLRVIEANHSRILLKFGPE